MCQNSVHTNTTITTHNDENDISNIDNRFGGNDEIKLILLKLRLG